MIAGIIFDAIWTITGNIDELISGDTAFFDLTVNSSVGRIDIGAADNTFIDVDDGIGLFTADGNFDNGVIIARILHNATIAGDVNSSVFSLLNETGPANSAFTTMGTWFDSRGNLGTLRFGGMERSLVSLGVIEGFGSYDNSMLPDTFDDFAIGGRIESVVVSGNNNPNRASFLDSVVRAWRIGTIRLLDVVGTAQPASAIKYGFALRHVDTYFRTTPAGNITHTADKLGNYELRIVHETLDGLV